MKIAKKILTLTFLSIFSSGIFAQSLDEIINKHIEAVGGQSNWDKVKSVKTESIMKVQGAEIQMVILQVDKKAMRQDITVMGMKGYMIVTTKEGWNFMPWAGQTKPEPYTADDLKNSQDELYIHDEFLTYK